MVEIRVAVADDTSVDGLMRWLAAVFGRSSESRKTSVRARLSIGEHSYVLAGPPLLPAGR